MIDLLKDETVPEPFAHPSRGPWRQMDGIPCVVESATGHFVATVDTEPDARLIAAAPELLAVLKSIAENAPNERPRDWLMNADDAIAKAEGR